MRTAEDAVSFITDPEDKPAEDAMREIRALDGYLLEAFGVKSLLNRIDLALTIPNIQKNDVYLTTLRDIAMRLTERVNYYENPKNAGITQKFIWGKQNESVKTELNTLSDKILGTLNELQTKHLPNNTSNYQQSDFQNGVRRTF